MFIEAHKGQWPVSLMCCVLDVSRSGYHAWLRRTESSPSLDDQRLLKDMRSVFDQQRRAVGSRRMAVEMRAKGHTVGRHKVRRLMREDGMVAKRTRRKVAISTTDSSHGLDVADNKLQRQFKQQEPNKAWVCDITYVPTLAGFVYVSIVMDLFSRGIIGWNVSDTMTQQLTIEALASAWCRRGRPTGVIVHSDRGVQYAAAQYRRLLTDTCGCIQSMSRKANCWDNAPAESFFATLKTELCSDHVFTNLEDVRKHVWQFIEVYYNQQRRHSTLGNVSPKEFEDAYFRMRQDN